MVQLLASVNFQEVLSAQNLLSPTAFLLYALALVGIVFCLVLFLVVRGKVAEAAQRGVDAARTVERKVNESSDLLHGLHDGFSGLADEFKFFKEKVMVKLNSNARILEMMPAVSDQVAKIAAAPAQAPAAGDAAELEAELAEARETLTARAEKIRSLELEVENFHKILEAKSLETGTEESPESLEQVRQEREELVAEQEAFQANSEKIKQEIQVASDKLREMQEQIRLDRSNLDEERRALEEEKAELAQMAASGDGGAELLQSKVETLTRERDQLKEQLERAQGEAPPSEDAPAPAPVPYPPESADPAEPPEQDEEPEEEEAYDESEEEVVASTEDEFDDEESEDEPAEEAAEAPAAQASSGWAAVLSSDAAPAASAETETGPPPPEPAVEEYGSSGPEPEREDPAMPPPEDRSTFGHAGGFETEDRDGIFIVSVHYDDMKRPEAQELIDLVFDRSQEKEDRILLDFTLTNYINSSGMSAITKIAVERNCQIVLINKDILKVIDLMGFLPLLNINETFEEALTAFTEED